MPVELDEGDSCDHRPPVRPRVAQHSVEGQRLGRREVIHVRVAAEESRAPQRAGPDLRRSDPAHHLVAQDEVIPLVETQRAGQVPRLITLDHAVTFMGADLKAAGAGPLHRIEAPGHWLVNDPGAVRHDPEVPLAPHAFARFPHPRQVLALGAAPEAFRLELERRSAQPGILIALDAEISL